MSDEDSGSSSSSSEEDETTKVESNGIPSKITVKQLKAELRSRGLKVSGLKHQLILRLNEHLSV